MFCNIFWRLHLTALISIMVLAFNTVPVFAEKEADAAEAEEIFGYSVYKLFFKIGSVRLANRGLIELEGKDALHLSFESSGPNFFDRDDIYLDPDDPCEHRFQQRDPGEG
jgi:hypothetical protein